MLINALSIFLVFTVSAVAGPEIIQCDSNDVLSIQRPLYPDEKTTKEFKYSFRYVKKGGPTVIYLPGGPGAPSIALSEFMNSYGIPDSYSKLFTEPRGRGCNETAEFKDSTFLPTKAFSTNNLAEDVIAVIQSQGLKNYILFGHSYGTQLATVIAAKLEILKLPKPRAVVLQSTVGRALSHPYMGFIKEWNGTKLLLPSSILTKLSHHPLPYYPEPYWGAYILHELTTRNPFDKTLAEKLALLDKTESKELSELLKDVYEAGSRKSQESYLKLYRPIWCRELAKTDNTDVTLINGDLVGYQDPTVCHDYQLTNPYDSKSWQIETPIFYFQGENDPATPLSEAKYHYLNQTSSDKQQSKNYRSWKKYLLSND